VTGRATTPWSTFRTILRTRSSFPRPTTPGSAQEIWSQLDSFIKSQPDLNALRSSIAPCNTGRTPWNQQLDLRILQDIPVDGLARNCVQVTKTDAATRQSTCYSFPGVPNNTPWP
jgi:hypothetical protein